MVDQNIINKNIEIFAVSEITAIIKNLLKESFPFVYIKGEISNFKIASSGHAYFSLKDEKAVINCALFRNVLQKIKFKLENGLEVIASGSIGVYEPSGSYNLIVEDIIPEGKGALQLAFEQLKEKLNKEGLFSPEHKKDIPDYPQKIGIITSLQGAALRDILKIINRRFPNVHIQIFPAVVQGKNSAKTIVKGIKVFNKFFPVDVIILGRGGGSIEDLWSFNEEIVARAIYNSRIPIISAVGHEIDYTIADFVADMRASTPSAAAELVVKNKEDIYRIIEYSQDKILDLLYDFMNTLIIKYDRSFEKFKNISKDILKAKVSQMELLYQRFIQMAGARISNEKNRFITLFQTYSQACLNRHNMEKTRFETLANKIALLNPFIILKRGYSISYKMPEGIILKDKKQVKVNDKIKIKLFKGEIQGKVIE